MSKDQRIVDLASSSEPDLAPLVCLRCRFEFEPEGEPWPNTCPNCGSSIDLKTQFAYARGRDAFIAGQDLLMNISPRKRRRNLTTSEEMEGLRYYNQAYTSMQIAFQGMLAESQRRLGIEIMAAIAIVFQQHGNISLLEAGYWSALMMELTMQIDREEVAKKISRTRPGAGGLLVRWRWQLRLEQLDKALAEQNARIENLEKNISFVERPRVRRKVLPPI